MPCPVSEDKESTNEVVRVAPRATVVPVPLAAEFQLPIIFPVFVYEVVDGAVLLSPSLNVMFP